MFIESHLVGGSFKRCCCPPVCPFFCRQRRSRGALSVLLPTRAARAKQPPATSHMRDADMSVVDMVVRQSVQ